MVQPDNQVPVLGASWAKTLTGTVRDGYLALAGVLLAISLMGNYWDFAIYLVVAAMVLVLASWRGCA